MKRKVAKLQNLQASEFTYMLVWDCQPQGVEGSKPSLAAPRMGVDGAQTWHQGTLQSPSRYSHCPLLQDLCPGHSPVKQKMPTCLGGPSPGCTQPEDCPKLPWKHGASFIQQPTLPSQALGHCSHALLSPGSGAEPS